MKKLLTQTALVVGFAVAGIGTAFAYGGHGNDKGSHEGRGMGHEMGMHEKSGHGSRDPAKMQERFTKRIAELKTKLAITAAQESAWTTFTTAMQPPKDRPDMRKMHEEMAKLNTPARIDKMNALHAEKQAEMTKRGEATKALYNALTPEQRKVFDDAANKMMGGKRHS
jgi:Spy/CpxP family protein refolding chaperone